jgi:hypothetical protein
MVTTPTAGLDLPLRRSRSPVSRRRLLAGVVALVAVLGIGAAVLAGDDGGGGGSTAGGDRAAVAAELREVADRVQVGDGPRGPELAQRLRALAQQVDGGAGGDEASALADDVVAWRESGELFRTAGQLALDALAAVPGAEVP